MTPFTLYGHFHCVLCLFTAEAPLEASNEETIAQLKDTLSQLSSSYKQLCEEMAHLSRYVAFHEKALRHMSPFGDQRDDSRPTTRHAGHHDTARKEEGSQQKHLHRANESEQSSTLQVNDALRPSAYQSIYKHH